MAWLVKTTDRFDLWLGALNDHDRASVIAAMLVLQDQREKSNMGRTLEQILEQEKPEVVANAQQIATDALMEIKLAKLRSIVDKTQAEIAETMGVKQPTVSEMEREGHDPRLSSLKRYVEASGGKLKLDVEFQDGTHFGLNL